MSEAQTKLDIAKQAQKRSEKLTSELGSWIAEKNANASAQAVCRAQISDAQALLDKREEVEAGSRSYGKLSARREELLGTAALIQPKEEKLRDVMAALSTQRKKKSSLEAEKLSAQATCWSYEQALADYEELERKAADLAGASERLAALEEQDEQYLAADQEAMKLLQTKNAETARIQSWLGIKESEVVHIRSRAIMLETCGCPVENPECRFLQDAVEAKKKLPTAETELETYDSTTYMMSVVKNLLAPQTPEGAQKPVQLILPNDNDLVGQLSTRKYSMTDDAKIRVESKDAMKKRGMHSPDEADCILLLCLPVKPKRRGDVKK